MADAVRAIHEALEEDGYEVDSVRPYGADPDGTEIRGGGAWLPTYVLWLALYLSHRAGEELTGELVRDALEKVKQVVRRLRAEGDRQAQETEAISIWLPDGSGGWELVESERIDD